MSNISKLSLLALLFVISGCAGLTGFTGADAGNRVGEWVEYNVKHPGLTVKIIEPFSQELMPISTIGKTSPSPLRHTVMFGEQSNSHKLELVGRYQKDIYLDGKFYGSIWTGDVVIKDGVISIDGKLISETEN